jgi:hypothetical protein
MQQILLSKIKNRAATIIQKYARRIIVYQTIEFPVDLFIEKEWAIGTCSMCGLI